MEQDQFSVSVMLGNDRILFPANGVSRLLQQGWDEPRHCNADWELHLILQGTCHIDVEDRSYDLRSGQSILIAPSQYHRPEAPSGSFSRFTLSFSVRTESLRQALRSRVPSACVIQAEPAFYNLAMDITKEYGSGKDFSRSYIEAMLTLLTVQLLRTLQVKEVRTPAPKAVKNQDLTTLIDDYFEQNFAAWAGEEDLANWLHLSRRQVVRILQEIYGMNFRQKLIHTRMDYAAWLLRTTDNKISYISTTVGYHSEAAFFQVFRKYYGISPRQYRLQKQNRNA